MIQRRHSDMILRMIQDTAKLIALLLGKDIREAEEHLDKAYNEWLGLDRKGLDNLSDADFKAKLLGAEGLDLDSLAVLAELLAGEGQLFYQRNQFSKSKKNLQRALLLLEEVEMIRQVFSFQKQQKIQGIKALINDIDSHYQNDPINDDLR